MLMSFPTAGPVASAQWLVHVALVCAGKMRQLRSRGEGDANMPVVTRSPAEETDETVA